MPVRPLDEKNSRVRINASIRVMFRCGNHLKTLSRKVLPQSIRMVLSACAVRASRTAFFADEQSDWQNKGKTHFEPCSYEWDV